MEPAHPEQLVAEGARRRRMHRTVDATTLWQLGILVVVWAGGALLVATVAELVRYRTEVDPRTVVGVWTASGLLVFVPPVEVVLGRVVLSLRKPSPEQLAVLQGAWDHVCAQAGVRGGRYVLRVQPSGWLNATAGAGHLVGVTTTALSLTPRQLEAVLAHELGHHLAGHAMIGLLHGWYSWPMRILVRLCGIVGRIAGIAMTVLRPFAPLLALFLLPLALLSCVGSLLVPIIALPVTVSTVVMRRSELRADGTAVRLGYGADLLALYQWFAAREGPAPRGWRSLRAFLGNSHPRFDVRVRALQRALGLA